MSTGYLSSRKSSLCFFRLGRVGGSVPLGVAPVAATKGALAHRHGIRWHCFRGWFGEIHAEPFAGTNGDLTGLGDFTAVLHPLRLDLVGVTALGIDGRRNKPTDATLLGSLVALEKDLGVCRHAHFNGHLIRLNRRTCSLWSVVDYVAALRAARNVPVGVAASAATKAALLCLAGICCHDEHCASEHCGDQERMSHHACTSCLCSPLTWG